MQKQKTQIVDRISPFVILSLTMLLCLVVRISSLDSIPPNVTADEGDTLRTYIHLSKQFPSLLTLNWNGSSSVNTYLVGSLWTLGGETLASIKYASVIMSMIALLLFYLIILKISRNALLASLATTALSTNVAFLNFSRAGWENVFTSVPLLILVYILHNASFPLKPKYMFLFILSMVMSMYLYHPGKILFVVSYIWFIVSLLCAKTTLRRKLKDIVLVSVVVCILSLPIIYSTLSPTTNGISRINNVSVLNTDKPLYNLAHNVVVNTRALFVWDNNNLRYGMKGTVLNYPILIIYLISFALALLHQRKALLFFCLNFLIIQIFSQHTPDIARGVHLIPMMYYLIVVAVVSFQQWTSKSTMVIQGIYKGFYILVLISFAFATLYDMRQYILFATDAETIESRRPAVQMKDYTLWRDATRKDPLGLNLYKWEDYIEHRSKSY